MATHKTAIILFNLGGPSDADSVQPFLKNLFSDPAIIRVPGPVRWMLARLISSRRAESAKANYALMDANGGSPIVPETERQARALEAVLNVEGADAEYKCFLAMRYWHPMTEETAAEVAAWGADRVIALPLYPQYSSTTTASSLKEWERIAGTPDKTICCYPYEEGFLKAHKDRIMEAWERAGQPGNLTLLLSAHGLPEKVIQQGDPYQHQIETMANKLSAMLPQDWEFKTCYQSRVGPMKWIGPSTDECVEEASKAGKNILAAPIAFVSEHIETLVEIGDEYHELAMENGAASFTRVHAVGTHPDFIQTLAELITADPKSGLCSASGERVCPSNSTDCPFR